MSHPERAHPVGTGSYLGTYLGGYIHCRLDSNTFYLDTVLDSTAYEAWSTIPRYVDIVPTGTA